MTGPEILAFVAAHWARILITLIVGGVVMEHVMYWINKRGVVGPTFVVPFIGSIVQMVLHPYEFWHKQFAMGKVSVNKLVGSLIVVSNDAAATRQIFLNSSEEMPLILHPNAYKLLGKNNMAFMNGPYHKELRTRLLPLFTLKALSVYLDIQQKTIHEFFAAWVQEFSDKKATAEKDGLAMKNRIWDLNCQTSMQVFIGPYLNDKNRKEIQFHYKRLTEGFLAFPINLPGTALNDGIKSKHLLIPLLEDVAHRCKARMASGVEPTCLLDFWMQTTVKEIAEAEAAGKERPPHSTDNEVANITLDFLFASQDASTASLTWCLDTCTRYPEVLKRVRDEQQRLRPNNETITLDLMGQMKYTNQVMREILRMYPPATMVPHINHKPTKVGDYDVPLQSLIIPSIYSATHQGYTEPNKFDPDRYGDERQEDKKFDKEYFLTFGAGPHACLGQRYAQNHLALFLSMAATELQIERKWTPASESMLYAPTIYPADECLLSSVKPYRAQV